MKGNTTGSKAFGNKEKPSLCEIYIYPREQYNDQQTWLKATQQKQNVPKQNIVNTQFIFKMVIQVIFCNQVPSASNWHFLTWTEQD